MKGIRSGLCVFVLLCFSEALGVKPTANPDLPAADSQQVQDELSNEYNEAVTLLDCVPVGRSQCTKGCGIGFAWVLYHDRFVLQSGLLIKVNIYKRARCCDGPCTGGNGPPPPILCRDVIAGTPSGAFPSANDPELFWEIDNTVGNIL